MGNQQANDIASEVASKRITPLLKMTDCYIGNYLVLQNRTNTDSLYLQTQLNPEHYDQYVIDYEEFKRKIQASHEGICSFYSIDPSESNPEIYDMFFEFGHYLMVLENTKSIWEFIHQAVAGMCFLEANQLHYPFLRKKYFVYITSLRRFKVVNPFCFPPFLADYMRVYNNSNVTAFEKASFLKGKLNVNVREFGFVILSLIYNVDEASFIQSPSLIKQKVSETRGKFGDELFGFLSFLIECRAQLTFRDVQLYLKNGGHPLFVNPLLRNTIERGEFRMSAQLTTGMRVGGGESGGKLSLGEGQELRRDQRILKLSHEPNRVLSGSGGQQTRQLESARNVPIVVPERLSGRELAEAALKLPVSTQQSDTVQQPQRVAQQTQVQAPKQQVQQPVQVQVPAPVQAPVPAPTKPQAQAPNPTPQPQPATAPVEPQSPAPAQPQTNPTKTAKLVKKRIKWVTEKQCHMEVLEYDDGTSEERVPQNQEMLKQIMKNFQTKMAESTAQQPTSTPHAPKPSAMHLYNPDTLTAKSAPNDPPKQPDTDLLPVSIVLFLQDNSQSGKVIYKNSIPNTFDSFTEMRSIVDSKNPLKISKYHNESADLFASLDTGASLEESFARSQQDDQSQYKIITIEAHPFSANQV